MGTPKEGDATAAAGDTTGRKAYGSRRVRRLWGSKCVDELLEVALRVSRPVARDDALGREAVEV